MAGYQRFGFYTRDNEHLVGGVYRTLTGRQDSFMWGDATKEDRSRPQGLLARPKAKDPSKATIVMPDEKDLPAGWTASTVRGLMDHEMAGAIFGSLDISTVVATKTTKAISYILDESRVQGRMEFRFPGSADNYEAMNEVGIGIVEKRIRKYSEEATSQKPEEVNVLNPLVLGINAATLDPKTDFKELYEGHPWQEDLAYTMEQLLPDIKKAKRSWSMDESIKLAKAIVEKLKLPDDEEDKEDDQGEGEGKGGGPSDEFKKALADALAKDGEDPDGKGSGTPGEGEAESAATTMLQNVAQASDKAKEKIMEQIKKDLLDPKKSGILKPIYDLDMMAAREQDQEIRVYEKSETYRAVYKIMHEKIRNYIAPLRSALRIHLLSEARTRYRFEQEAGDLCKKSLYQIAQGTSTRVFQTMHRGKSKKTVVTILIDASGSMGSASRAELSAYNPRDPVSSSHMDKAFHAAMTACALTEALRGMPGIRVEVSSFTAHGKLRVVARSSREECLHHHIYKPFDKNEPSGIAAMVFPMARGNNCDGESVRWAARRLLSASADRRILLVLSDGYPASAVHESGGNSLDNDLRSAVKACENNGIETIGIGIKSDAVKKFYPKHVVINNVSELMGTAMRQLLELLDKKASKS